MRRFVFSAQKVYRRNVLARSLSLLPAGSFRLYIHDAFGLAFLYDPILLESPEATYVVEWSEVTGARTTRTYIAEAREKHAEMHTFIYAPRKVRSTCYESGDL